MHTLRFRQVHLDFHTSPAIAGVGARFDKKKFQSALKAGHVDSISVFSKCHHGWSYHPTTVGKMHPGLGGFDLLRAQVDACREIGVATPVYLSAGIDDLVGHEHPEWRRSYQGRFTGWQPDPTGPGFAQLCFRSPYLDYLCDQIREACRLFPEANGIFLDIINAGRCTCEYCVRHMKERGLDPRSEADLDREAEDTLRLYYERTTAAARELDPSMPVFHNSGNFDPKHRDLLPFFSHLELESLPTGGWGYDHFPLSAKYVAGLGKDFLGMTGKFHTSWGEFGGFKHPNALRYECAAMLAYGAKCSVGDQLHPDGHMDESTYDLIGAAYAEVERKEPWCGGVRNVADVAILQECAQPGCPSDRATASDIGAGRMLLEEHILFDLIDNDADFGRYRLLVLPDAVRVDAPLRAKLEAYLAAGGKLFLSAASGLDADRKGFLFDVGATTEGVSPYAPDYVLPKAGFHAPYVSTPMVAYEASQRLTVTDGESLGDVFDPYFNRTSHDFFCSHQHTPNRPDPSGFACGVRKGSIVYLAHPVFRLYARFGATAVREYAMRCLRALLGAPTLDVEGLPTTGRATLQRQAAEGRSVLHLLYAPTVKRGGIGGRDVEIIEDFVPLAGIKVALRPAEPVSAVRLVPQGEALPFTRDPDGTVRFVVPSLLCHQMVELS